MTSVFDTPAPNFTIKDAERIASDHFGVNGSADSLVSDRDQNFWIKSSNRNFVLKISNSMEDINVLDMQNEAMQYIYQKTPHIDLTHPIKSNSGQKILQIERIKYSTL